MTDTQPILSTLNSRSPIHTVTVPQPAASLLACGRLRHITLPFRPAESRVWVAIHASDNTTGLADVLALPVVADALRQCGLVYPHEGPDSLPTGAYVGLARLQGAEPAVRRADTATELEQAVSYYGGSFWVWRFTQPRLICPLPARGRPGLRPLSGPVVRHLRMLWRDAQGAG